MSQVLDKNIETNPLIERLPAHLKQYIKPQNYDNYTAINQAVWRYVMRKNVAYLSTVAHKSYLDGLKQTGISEAQLLIFKYQKLTTSTPNVRK